jgi:ribosomal protein S27E
MSLLAKYQERVQHQHGWEVELQCPECNHVAVPKYDGWTASKAIKLGDTPTIYANLTCSDCGRDLKEAAGGKLKELFKDVAIPVRNKGLLYKFLFVVIGLPLILMGFLWAGVVADWWGYGAFGWLGLIAFITTPAIFYFNYNIHAIRFVCECGNPRYLSMGLLGRSYCYRCSSCAKCLRLRD